MPKFSVKKPLTVFVAGLAILVLGVVAYLKMTPDLMPNMDFPYVVIVTTSPGASPETVEADITKPMEQSMATLNEIKHVTSSSKNSVSMVVLEFEQGVNMDSTGVDIQQKIATLQGGWDDTVGTPYVLKINPTMLPVAVAAVSSDKMDVAELSEFVDSTLSAKLEGITGVASVSVSGVLQRQMNVILSQEKLDALSEKLAVHAFDAFGFADAPSDEILPREGHGRLASFGGFQLDVEERQRKARILDVVRNERGAGADADFYARKHLSGIEFGAGEQSGVIGRGNALHAVLHQRVAHEPACVRRAAVAVPEREERSGAFADGQVYVVHSDPDEASVGCELHVARPDAAQRHAAGGGVVFQPETVEIGASAQKSLRGDETYVGCAGAVVGFLRVQTGGREEQAERCVQEFDSHGFRGFTA